MDKSKSKFVLYSLSVASFLLYVVISYFLQRTQSTLLIASFVLLFGIYIAMLSLISAKKQISRFILIGILFRIVLLLAFPNLSDDLFRFVWDGRLMNNGIHPFAHLPSFYLRPDINIPGVNQELYDQLNSPEYFTIYPPVAQFVFWLSVKISPNSVFGSAIVMRILILSAEIGSILLMRNLIRKFSLNEKNVLIYVLNPLVIIELTGNLHFEAFMIFFALLSLYLLWKSKLIFSAGALALAVASKLIPLIFLPLLLKRLKIKQLAIYYILAGVFTILLFLPILNEKLVEGMSSSISLYFQKFEFNASIYYLVREIGFWIKGYNIIQTAGKYLALATFAGIMLYSLLSNSNEKKLPEGIMWVLVIYLLFATIVHPWYITTIIAFSVFTNYKFPVLWSLLIFLTYLGYTSSGFEEKLWVNIIEYGAVLAFVLYEIYHSFKPSLAPKEQ